MKFRTNYQEQTWDPGTLNKEPSMVKPEFELEGEINNIMARYVKTGYLPPEKTQAIFGDWSMPVDFDTAQDKILTARKAFIDLPIEVRDEFRTAEGLLNAFNSPKGRKKLEEHGLLTPKQTDASAAVPGSGVEPQKSPKETPAS